MNYVYVLMWRINRDSDWMFDPMPKAQAYEERDRMRNAGMDVIVLKGE